MICDEIKIIIIIIIIINLFFQFPILINSCIWVYLKICLYLLFYFAQNVSKIIFALHE